MAKISGGCLCGRVRYTSDAEPAMIAACHCTHCQKQSGSAFSMNLALPLATLKLEGDTLAAYEDGGTASGLPMLRRFCSRCGSPIVSEPKSFPGVGFLKAGTLDDASWVKPAVQIWCRSRQPWWRFDGVPELPENPPAG